MEVVQGPDALAGRDPDDKLGEADAFPRTPGARPPLRTERPWTTRQYAGPGTAVEANIRFKRLIANGTTGLPVVFDLPTRTGHDSDTAVASGKVGRAGVAIDSIDDMRVLFGGIPLNEVSTSLTVNAPGGALFLLLCQLVGEEQGVAADQLTGTIRHDVLKEYTARGTHIFPPKPSLRLIADIFRYCKAEIPKWDTVSVSGHRMAGAGASPAQEIAFTLADGIEYVRAAVAAGMDVDDVAPRLTFLFRSRTTVLEEVAKCRAAHRIWARLISEEFGTRTPESLVLRLTTQTAGVRLTARQPKVNPVRVAVQGLAAVLSVTQSPHALAGSHVAERMTDDVEAAALELMRRVEDLGGAVSAVAQGFQKGEIERNAHRVAQARETRSGERVVAGVHRFPPVEEEPYEPLLVGSAIEVQQAERLCKLRAVRDLTRVDDALVRLKKAAAGTDNVLYPMKEALAAYATVGEVCDALREVWGTYTPTNAFRVRHEEW